MPDLNAGATVGYTYRYDQLNRLTTMDRHNIASNATAWDNTGIIQAYKEAVSYDANSNIRTYLRNGADASGMPEAMDDLDYGYNTNYSGRIVNNMLRHVKDAVSAGNYAAGANGTADIDDQPDDNYTYDKIGNLVGDETEQIDRISWTVYGKIASIEKKKKTTKARYSMIMDLEFMIHGW